MFISALHTRRCHAIIRRNLIGWWPLNEGGGSVASDMSGNGINGTLTNDPGWAANPFNTAGASAIDFDGSNDYIALPTGSAASLKGAVSVSMCGWLDLDALTTSIGLVTIPTSGTGSTYARFVVRLAAVSTDFQWQLAWRDATADPIGTIKTVISGVNAATGIQHVAATWDSVADQQKIYINGSLVKSDTVATGSLGTSTPQFVRIGMNATSQYTNGRQSDTRLYASFTDGSGVLTADEIATIYAGRG